MNITVEITIIYFQCLLNRSNIDDYNCMDDPLLTLMNHITYIIF